MNIPVWLRAVLAFLGPVFVGLVKELTPTLQATIASDLQKWHDDAKTRAHTIDAALIEALAELLGVPLKL